MSTEISYFENKAIGVRSMSFIFTLIISRIKTKFFFLDNLDDLGAKINYFSNKFEYLLFKYYLK